MQLTSPVIGGVLDELTVVHGSGLVFFNERRTIQAGVSAAMSRRLKEEVEGPP